MSSTTRIAVIGAGAAGLTQLKQLLDAFSRSETKSQLEVVCFEARDQVGGTWIQHPHPQAPLSSTIKDGDAKEQMYFYPPQGDDPSPIYDGLRTNLPHDLMSFRGVPFPEGTALFPDQLTVLQYLQNYAKNNNLHQHIRFNTPVNRVFLSPSESSRRWTIEYGGSSNGSEEFDFISVANGHYSDSWLPEIPGLSSFPGEVIHSRYYRRPVDYIGKTVLVVGSYASGSDITRQIAGVNVGLFNSSGEPLPNTPTSENGSTTTQAYTRVYQSSSGAPNPHAAKPGDAPQPWKEFIEDVPLISSIQPASSSNPKGVIKFRPSPWSTDNEVHAPITDVDVIIFATGYNFSYPFFKTTDAPWKDQRILDGVIKSEERAGGAESEIGGLKGLGVRELDEILLFLQGDRSIAFPALPYQVVPFPLSEVQARLTSLLWANLLPTFPSHPILPPNPTNPYFTPPDTPNTTSPPSPSEKIPQEATTISTDPLPTRQVLSTRQKLVFGAPYEWVYSEYLMSLMAEADAGKKTEEWWTSIEAFRRERRADSTLRKRTLGY